MRRSILNVLILGINVVVYFFFQVISSFVQFLLYGEGSDSGRYDNLWSSIFAVIQIFTLVMLYQRRAFIDNKLFLFVNMGIVVLLTIYFIYF